MPCDDGDVRLTEETMGPLMVCVNKRWVTVCYDGWTNVDSSVACRQLGYTSGERYVSTVYKGITKMFAKYLLIILSSSH